MGTLWFSTPTGVIRASHSALPDRYLPCPDEGSIITAIADIWRGLPDDARATLTETDPAGEAPLREQVLKLYREAEEQFERLTLPLPRP